MIPHYILLLGILLGSIEISILIFYIKEYLYSYGAWKYLIYIFLYIAGIFIGQLQLWLIIKLFNKK